MTTNISYVYPSTSNRLDEVRDASTSALLRDPGYRANGQMATDNRVGDGAYEYVYDANGRMIQAKKNGASIATYGYDSAGRRITRSVVSPALTRDYLYLPDGRMLAEADGTGATVREYIWLGNLPLAIVNKAGATMTTYYVHAGHLNQPLVVTDSAKAKVWDATLEAFGQARLFTTTVEMNLRLPGQYFHAESALAQNWMRDYDPALGRYIQPDPIGLAGGPNVYGYVGQDPLNAADSTGEFGWLVVGGVVRGLGELGAQMAGGTRFGDVNWGKVGISAAAGALTGGAGALVAGMPLTIGGKIVLGAYLAGHVGVAQGMANLLVEPPTAGSCPIASIGATTASSVVGGAMGGSIATGPMSRAAAAGMNPTIGEVVSGVGGEVSGRAVEGAMSRPNQTPAISPVARRR